MFPSRLSDEVPSVRQTAVTVLTQLVLKDVLKVKGQVSEVAVLLIDPEPHITSLALNFFNELSTKVPAHTHTHSSSTFRRDWITWKFLTPSLMWSIRTMRSTTCSQTSSVACQTQREAWPRRTSTPLWSECHGSPSCLVSSCSCWGHALTELDSAGPQDLLKNLPQEPWELCYFESFV